MPENTPSFKGTKLGKSHVGFVKVPYFLSKYDPGSLREPLFKKLDESVVEEEYPRLEG